MTSGAVAAINRGFLLAAAVPIFAISSARPGLLSIFFPTFLPPILPKCLKKSPNPSPSIVRSDTIRLLFLLHTTQLPRSVCTGLPIRIPVFVISP